MKKLLLVGAVLVAGFTANAADEFQTLVVCQPLVLRPDLGLSVTLEQGGFAGITQVVVNRYFLGHHTTEQYLVKLQPSDPRRLGAPVTYVGRGISFSVNYTAAPTKTGGNHGVLSTAGADDRMVNEQLDCHSNNN